MTEPTIADRINRAYQILGNYVELGGTDQEAALRDLLADLMHWATANKVDFPNELRIAFDNYEAERDEGT